MWSFVGKKKDQRWLWHAIHHTTGAVLAYVFGRRKDKVFLELKALLEPLGSPVFILIIGVRTHGISTLKGIVQVSVTHSKSSGNT